MALCCAIGPTCPPKGFQLGGVEGHVFLPVFGLVGFWRLLEVSWGPRGVPGSTSMDFGLILTKFWKGCPLRGALQQS
eukprot:12140840-Karenia_brevis.AAC.1